jgi:hypothetical protein
MSDENQESQRARRLPLWRTCIDRLRAEQLISYGQVIKSEFFERELECKRDSMEFGLAISSIRRELEADGFYLSGRGQKGNQFVILPPASNASVMNQYSRAAIDALRRGTILGTNTRIDLLSESERRRHEGVLDDWRCARRWFNAQIPWRASSKSTVRSFLNKNLFWRGSAGPGVAWRGPVGQGKARSGQAWQGGARLGRAGLGKAWNGLSFGGRTGSVPLRKDNLARRGPARQGSARHGRVGRAAWRGRAWQGIKRPAHRKMGGFCRSSHGLRH